MNEYFNVLLNSFRKVCQLECKNVSVIKLIMFSLIIAGLVHMGCLIYVKVKRHSIYLSTELIIILLISYTYFIAQITLMSRGLGCQVRVFDTKLLWFDKSIDQNMTNLMNIILFIPFGTLVAGILINKNNIKRLILVINYCFLTSLVIECAQYITKRGYFEIDDLEANIVGGLIGSIFFSLCLKIGRLMRKENTEVEDEKETRTGHV